MDRADVRTVHLSRQPSASGRAVGLPVTANMSSSNLAPAANGIVGVAPNVTIAGIKSSTDDGFLFPEMVVCSFIWAGTHGIAVTNETAKRSTVRP
jgi:hypothetical protein